MCDPGASKSIMSFRLFEKLQRDQPSQTRIEPYDGVGVESLSGKIELIGRSFLRKAQISNTTTIHNPQILVAHNLKSPNMTLIFGRDLIKEVPEFQDLMTRWKSTLKTMKQELSHVNLRLDGTTLDENSTGYNLLKEHDHSPNCLDGTLTCNQLGPERRYTSEIPSPNINLRIPSQEPQENRTLTNDPPDNHHLDGEVQINGKDCSTCELETKEPAKYNENKKTSINSHSYQPTCATDSFDNHHFDDKVQIESEVIRLNPHEASSETIERHRQEIRELMSRCSASTPQELRPEQLRHAEFKIELNDPNMRPIRCKARPVPHALKQKVKDEIKSLLDAGIIRRSKSQWAAPLQIVMKDQGKIRITVDYTALNPHIKFDPYPMPNPRNIFDRLANSEYYSTWDFYKGYHQIPVESTSIGHTAFICEHGHYEYVTMPMGIKTAAAWFQRLVDDVVKILVEKGVVEAYQDDVVLHTKTLEEHMHYTRVFIELVELAGLRFNPDKCCLIQKEVKFLGHIIAHNTIKTDPKRAECISNMPKPKTIQHLQSALGIFGYQREFIHKYQELAQPLYDMQNLKEVPANLRKKNGTVKGKLVDVQWSEETERCFYKLRDICSRELKLHMPNFTAEFHLKTDACNYACGGYLYQLNVEGEEQVIGYFSKSFTRAQRNYSTSEQELLGIILSIEFFHTYLYGRHFTVWTDHQPLTFQANLKGTSSSRLKRWRERLKLYSLTVKYIKGEDNNIADLLSRLPDAQQVNEEDEDFEEILIAYEQDSLPSTSSDNLNNAFRQDTSDSEEPATTSKTQDQPQHNAATASAINHINPDEFSVHQREQAKDDDITWALQLVKTHKDDRPEITTFDNKTRKSLYRNYNNLRIVDDVLYAESEDKKGNTYLRFALPQHSIATVLEKTHTSIYSGHLGRKKTLAKVLKRFYRPNLRDEILEYIKTCHKCQIIKSVKKSKAPLSPSTRTTQIR